jgi:ribosomal protein S18 acetylase RimI-like enzyme
MANLRLATESDIPAICALGEEVNLLHHEAFPHVFAGPGAPGRDRAHWTIGILKEDGATFVAEEHDAVVGFVTVSITTESHSLLQPICFGRVGSISVTSSMRGRGIGRELMRLAEEWVRDHGGIEVRLNVWAFNVHALHMYQELGYEVRSHQLARPIPRGG